MSKRVDYDFDPLRDPVVPLEDFYCCPSLFHQALRQMERDAIQGIPPQPDLKYFLEIIIARNVLTGLSTIAYLADSPVIIEVMKGVENTSSSSGNAPALLEAYHFARVNQESSEPWCRHLSLCEDDNMMFYVGNLLASQNFYCTEHKVVHVINIYQKKPWESDRETQFERSDGAGPAGKGISWC
jgi:hypothetical protein